MRKKRVRISENLTVKELSDILGLAPIIVVKALYEKEVMRTYNQIVERSIARKLAVDLGYELDNDGDVSIV